MKKVTTLNGVYSSLFLFTFSLLGCSKSSDNNKETIPLPPTNLELVKRTDKSIEITWTDRSTNESGFKIQRKTSTTQFVDVGQTAKDVTSFVDNGLSPSTTYTYRIYSFNSAGNSSTFSNELQVATSALVVPPVVAFGTPNAYYHSSVLAQIECRVISSDGANVTERGIVWSTSPNPNLNNNKVLATLSGVGAYSISLKNLTPGTKYYIKAFATSSAGTGFSSEESFTTKVYFTSGSGVTDIDGNNYKTIKIGNQEWMMENLKTTKFSNGEAIANGAWGTTNPSWVYPDNNIQNNNVYGKLYNWYAIINTKNICPIGWKVPSDSDWSKLEQSLSDFPTQFFPLSNKLKQAGTSYWKTETGATNESGFTALPAGGMNSRTEPPTVGDGAAFWSTLQSGSNVYYYNLSLNGFPTSNKEFHASVRCVKN